MATAAVVGVHILNADNQPIRAGTLTRNMEGATAFLVDEASLRERERTILSLG